MLCDPAVLPQDLLTGCDPQLSVYAAENATDEQVKILSRIAGRVVVDEGAADALSAKGKSLLSSGMTSVIGEFKRGDTVEIADNAGCVIARGLVNFSAAECRKISGKSSDELHKILGSDTEDEVIHRNNLTLME